MKAHMTSGTVDFLVKMAEEHPSLTLFMMANESSTLVYYEDKLKSIFVSGRSFDILIRKGNIQEDGFVVMNNIPIAQDAKSVFEKSFHTREQAVEKMPGFQAFRLLRPLKGNTYVILTQWASEEDFDNWKESKEFAKAHETTPIKKPAYFLEQPFISTYAMYDPEEEEEDEN